ncbi:MAG TPA: tyrosine recombinase XerC [Rhodocyclaceae bacterium]|nr:tyrosine recombinase XerC [Rhodocyclaceae bacterium]
MAKPDDQRARAARHDPEVLAPLFEGYLAYLSDQRRAAALTLENYARDMLRLQRLLEGRPPAAIGPYDVRRFAARLHAEGLGGRSIGRVLSAWRGFFRWLVGHHGLGANPVEHVRPPRSPRRLPHVLSPEQSKILLDAPGDEELDTRDRAMFELVYSAGLRVAELANLDVGGGLDLVEGFVTVTGKRGRTRTVPVGRVAGECLGKWVLQRPEWLRDYDQPALFVTRTGARMSTSAIRSRLSAWAVRSGVGVHVHPHMLRHSFATHMLQNSGDLRAVQELLGHASIRSTQVYTHLDFQHLAGVYDAAHPRARKLRET